MKIENMEFLEEEVVIEKLKIDQSSDPFNKSTLVHEKDNYITCKVLKIGYKQSRLAVGDKILVNQNGLPKQISIEGVGSIENTFVLPNHLRIFCRINE